MTKITEKTTDLEQHIIETTEQFKKMIGALSGNNNIELYIQFRGVPIETLVQTSQEIKTATDSGMTCDLTNHHVNIEFDNVHLSLNTLNEL